MLTEKELLLTVIKANIIDKIIKKEDCISDINTYITEINKTNILESLDVIFELVLTTLKDTYTKQHIEVEYSRYVKDIFNALVSEGSIHISNFYSDFLLIYLIAIQDDELNVSNKYEKLKGLDCENIGDISKVKIIYYNVLLNILMSKYPINPIELNEVNEKIKAILSKK